MSTIAIKESYMNTLRLFGEVDELLDEAVEQYLIDRIVERIKRARDEAKASRGFTGWITLLSQSASSLMRTATIKSIKVIHCGNRICWPGSIGMRRHESGQRSSTT